MNFEQYCAVIESTARVHCYSVFLPSLYEAGDKKQLHVYDALPVPGTDELVAKAWAQPYLKQTQSVYLAYRGDASCVHVCEFRDEQIVRQYRIGMEPGSYGACG